MQQVVDTRRVRVYDVSKSWQTSSELALFCCGQTANRRYNIGYTAAVRGGRGYGAPLALVCQDSGNVVKGHGPLCIYGTNRRASGDTAAKHSTEGSR